VLGGVRMVMYLCVLDPLRDKRESMQAACKQSAIEDSYIILPKYADLLWSVAMAWGDRPAVHCRWDARAAVF